ncbi:right-handed parallel beta-helix repeat-containing protein [Methanogenium sp. S4BF]|uniref:NosD domain-containing protein n=1 Tax=Methanogenium sp. S4BF TaxID=1789226 RepID=UPI002416DB8E|nr:NosD domain-containing protein [Methanogenium sp. S4BF]WFN34534.1 right-handed parallel beta-helix repeat-containing protein [Methanogenium sp. S4BF]
MKRLTSEPGGCLRWIAVMLLLFIFIGIAPASAEELPDCLHVYVNVSNDLGPRFSDSENGSYYMKFDGGGLNALHLTTDTAVPTGQVTTSNDQSGVFYITDTGGRGYSDNTILMFAVNGTVPDDFALTVRASGYVWEPVAVVNTLPLLENIEHIDGTMEETFTKEDLIYGPQTWKPAGNNLPKAYPIYYGQDTGDTTNSFRLMFIDLKAGPISKATGLASSSDLTDCGGVKVEYTLENLETFAAFNAYVWCNQSNQGQGISWTNKVADSGASVYQVIGIPPVIPTADFTADPVSGDAPLEVQFTDTSLDDPSLWAWDFENDGVIDSTEQNPTCTYTAAGTYSVNLTVTNSAGSDSVVKTDLITVTAPLPKTVTVGASGCDFTDLDSAFASPSLNDGDTILVSAGSYALSTPLAKTVTLTGEGADVVTVTPTGAAFSGAGTVIEGIGFTSGSFSVSGAESTVAHCSFTGFSSQHSIAISGQNVTLEGNVFQNNPTRFMLITGSGHTFTNNTFEANGGTQNAATRFDGCSGVTITRNTFANNTAPAIGLRCTLDNNSIFLNDFIDNKADLFQFTNNPKPLAMAWEISSIDYTYLGTPYTGPLGNYHSSYTGDDADGNGVIDTAYTIGTNQVDNAPLVDRWQTYFPEVTPKTVTVGASGCDFTDLDSAFASPSLNDGDTILVSAGSYALSTPLAKTVTLTGEGADVVTVTPTGAAFSGAGTVVEGIGFTSGSFSVSGAESTVAHCSFTGFSSQHSIAISGQNVRLEGNVFQNNPTRFLLVTGSGHTFTNNTFEANGGTQNAATRFDGCSGVTISRNMFVNNTAPAIGLRCTLDNNIIFLNDFIDNKADLFQFTNNPKPLAMAWEISSIGYTYLGTNYTGPLGNYHSSYTGDDADGNGVIDTAYTIGANQVDNAPLVDRWQTYLSGTGPEPVAPTANFTTDVTSGDAPLSVQFTDLSTGTPTSWAWDFENDGVIDSTEQNPTHIYTAAGIYTVNLTAMNVAGSDSDVKTDYITVIGDPSGPQPLPDYNNVFFKVANDAGVKYNAFENNTYNIRFEGYDRGLNALHISTDPTVNFGQVTVTENQTGTFYATDSGGKGYEDEILLMLAVNGTIPDDFSLRVQADGYTWTPNPVSNQAPALENVTYQPVALNETFTKEDFRYGPQIWKPTGNGFDYPIYADQNMSDTENTFQVMFIDLNAGVLRPNAALENNGAVRITYTFENLETFAAFNVYAYCQNSNNGDDMIAWSNALGLGKAGSGYSVVGAVSGPVPDRIEVEPTTVQVAVGDVYHFAATAFDALNNVISGLTFLWASSNEGVGTIDENGNFTALAPGTTDVTASRLSIVGTSAVTVVSPESATWYVAGDGSADFTTIQAAVDAANAGDTIIVRDGTYQENVDVTKSLVIRSENGSAVTTLYSVVKDSGFDITAADVMIDGFTVTAVNGKGNYGIYVHGADGALITNNTVQNCRECIKIESSSGNTVTNNILSVSNNAANNVFWLADASNNVIYLNEFNLGAVTIEGTSTGNVFSSPTEMQYAFNGADYQSYTGNYWNGYVGSDADGNGIGDEAYTIAGNVTDAYPLIQKLDAYTVYGPVPVGTTYYVSGDGSGDFTTIQAAVDAAADGDTIIVRDGTYQENVDVTKSLLIRSENGASVTTLYSVAKDSGFDIIAADVTIDGFTITTVTGKGNYGIYVHGADGALIINNTVQNCRECVKIESSSGNTVTNNILSVSNNAANNVFWLADASNNLIYKNDFNLGAVTVEGTSTGNVWSSPVAVKYRIDGAIHTSVLGNHWNGYTGSDTTGDGIGEEPYTIADGNVDAYPLVNSQVDYVTEELPEGISVTISPLRPGLQGGETLSFSASAFDNAGALIDDATFSWISSNTTVGTIDANGVFTAAAPGTTTITASYAGASASTDLTVGRVWYVDDSGGADFITIQAAVDAAGEGDYVVVRDGIYNESVSITKALTLRSENGPDMTVVTPGNKNYSGFTVSAKSVTIDGFGVRGLSKYGINLLGEAGSCTITNNSVSDSSAGIYLQICDGANLITKNTCNNNSDGIILMGSHGNYVGENVCCNNSKNGIRCQLEFMTPGADIHDNVVSGNIIMRNGDVALRFMGAINNLILNNTIAYNDYYGILLDGDSEGNVIYGNNFVENKGFYISNSQNSLNSSEPVDYVYDGIQYSGRIGNYYGEAFDLTDLNHDGIGDAPCYVSAAVDSYPLMGMYTDGVIFSSTTYYVGDDGGADFTTIQAAVDAASDGDAIIVRDGTYAESINVTRSISIRSENGAATTILSPGSFSGFVVTADGASVEGFTIDRVNGDGNFGVKITRAKGVSVINNTFNVCREGIKLDTAEETVIIGNDVLINNKATNKVLWLINSSNNLIYYNTFTKGIVTVEGTSSDNIWSSSDSVDYIYSGKGWSSHLGNTWPGYTGTDADGNGIGDTPYTLSDGSTDAYPLVAPLASYQMGKSENVVTSITVEPATAFLKQNDTCLFTATAFDQYDNEMADTVFTWTISDETVGTINESGFFSALSPGATTITAMNGTVEGTATVTVRTAEPMTIIVDASGAGDFTTIQAAIDAALDGDTIVVRDGSYTENLVIGKVVSLQSENGPEHAGVIAADPTAAVIQVSAGNVTISGFSISGTPDGSENLGTSGVYLVNADDCTIQENIITRNSNGIYVYRGNRNTIDRNTLAGNDQGLYINGYGGSTSQPHVANYNAVTQNLFTENVASNVANNGAVKIYYADNTVFTNNTISSNTNYGLILNHPDQTTVAHNVIMSNGGAGVYLLYSYDNTIYQNTIAENGAGFALKKGSGTCDIYLNDIIGNDALLVSEDGHDQNWNTLTPITYLYDGKMETSLAGNYWGTNYTGTDTDGNGIGDEPFVAGVYSTSKTYVDNYPLIAPYANYTLCDSAVLTAITLDPSEITLQKGQKTAFTATAFDQYGNEMAGTSFEWASSDSTIGTVNANGIFTAHGAGKTTITASNGDVSGTATVTVTMPHGDQTSDSPLNVPGCNISDKGDGTREVIVNLTATNATVNGNAIQIDEDTFSLIIETEGAPTVGNGTANGTVSGISLTTTPVSTNFDALGNVTASLMVNLTGIPSGAALETTISENVSAAAQSAFQIAATNDGLNLDAVAYTMNIVKTNLANGQDIADATIRMAVSPAWVAANGGYAGVKIIRFAEDGTMEVLNTVYLGFDGELDLFEALSPNGLSIFGLSATSTPGSSSGSGSSSSGGVSSSISTARCDGINAGETGVFMMKRTAITEIDVKAGTNIPSMMLTAEQVAKPSNIGNAPNAVYQYVEITSYLAPEDGMEMATLKFGVDKEWLDSIGAGASDVKMYHYDEATDSWVLLSTVACGEDGTCYTFFADTPSFSLFAISAEKGIASAAPESPEDGLQPAAAGGNTPAAGDQSPADTPAPAATTGNTTAIVILVVVAIIAVCGGVYWKKSSGKK